MHQSTRKTNLSTKREPGYEVIAGNYQVTERRVQSSKRSSYTNVVAQRKPWNSSVRVEQSNAYGRNDERRQKLPLYAANVVHSKSKGYRAWTTNVSVKRGTNANLVPSANQDSKVSELLDVTSTVALTFESESDKSASVSISRSSIRQRETRVVGEKRCHDNVPTDQRVCRCDRQSSAEGLKHIVAKICIWYMNARSDINKLKDTTRENIYLSICNQLDQLQKLLCDSLPEGSVSAGDLDGESIKVSESCSKRGIENYLVGYGQEVCAQLTSNSSCVHGRIQRELMIRPVQSPDSMTVTSKALESIREPALSLPLSSCGVDTGQDAKKVGKEDYGYRTGGSANNKNMVHSGPALQVNSSAATTCTKHTSQSQSSLCVENYARTNSIRGSNCNNQCFVTQRLPEFKCGFNSSNRVNRNIRPHQINSPHDLCVDEHYTEKTLKYEVTSGGRRSSVVHNNEQRPDHNKGLDMRQRCFAKRIVGSIISGTVFTKGYTPICSSKEHAIDAIFSFCPNPKQRLISHQTSPNPLEAVQIHFPFDRPTAVTCKQGHKGSQNDEQNSIVKAILMRGPGGRVAQDCKLTDNVEQFSTDDELRSSPLPDPPKDLFAVIGYPDPVILKTPAFMGTQVCTINLSTICRRKPRIPYLLWKCADKSAGNKDVTEHWICREE